MMRRSSALAAALLGAGLLAPHARAQAPAAKYATPTPPGIAVPDTLETGIGTLHFSGGFPDAASSQKLFDNLDAQRAMQAYLFALPALSQAAMRDAVAKAGPVNSTVLITPHMLDARSLFLTANNDTPYSIMWLDLSGGPLVLEVPPKVLGLVDDAWYQWVGDVGLTGADRGQGGKYLLLPPGYNGAVPAGYHVLRPRTFGNLVFWRTFLVKGSAAPGMELVKKYTRIYPLAKAANPPPMHFVDISGKAINTLAPADFHSWELIDQLVQHEPATSLDPITLGFFRAAGIVKGRPFAPDARMTKILTDAAALGDATARAITYRFRDKEAYFYPNSAWRTGFLGGYTFSENGARLLDAYSSFFFYATGITPAMALKMVGRGSQYAAAFVDSHGDPLDGGKNYRLHLPPHIPAKDFWSVIVYSDQTRSMLQTDQISPGLSGQTKGLVTNPDGSVDLYFGPTAPAGKEHNWIQTMPGQSWNTLLRLYGPLEPWFDRSWRPGEIEPLS